MGRENWRASVILEAKDFRALDLKDHHDSSGLELLDLKLRQANLLLHDGHRLLRAGAMSVISADLTEHSLEGCFLGSSFQLAAYLHFSWGGSSHRAKGLSEVRTLRPFRFRWSGSRPRPAGSYTFGFSVGGDVNHIHVTMHGTVILFLRELIHAPFQPEHPLALGLRPPPFVERKKGQRPAITDNLISLSSLFSQGFLPARFRLFFDSNKWKIFHNRSAPTPRMAPPYGAYPYSFPET